MRRMIGVGRGLAVLAAVLAFGCAGCSRGTAGVPPGSCLADLVSAIQQHITLTVPPRPCAGLSPAEVDQVVDRAIREAVGPRPKAAARQQSVRDSKFVGGLVRPVRPVAPAIITTAGRAGNSAALNLSAAGSWVLTAAAGSYLLMRVRRRRASRALAGPPAGVMGAHALVAIAGLITCAAFAVTKARPLAWAALALVAVAAGLGMATLLAALPGDGTEPDSGRPGQRRAPVAVIALHGILATITILLVILVAATG
jgi:hypothetical protein